MLSLHASSFSRLGLAQSWRLCVSLFLILIFSSTPDYPTTPIGRGFRKAPPKGPMTLGRPRYLSLTQVEVTLARPELFLLPDVLSYSLLVKANRTHTVPRRPKMQSRHPTFFQQFSVDPYRTLPFQKADRVRYAVLWRDAHTQVDVIRLRVAFYHFYSSLLTGALEEFAPRGAEAPPRTPFSDTLG